MNDSLKITCTKNYYKKWDTTVTHTQNILKKHITSKNVSFENLISMSQSLEINMHSMLQRQLRKGCESVESDWNPSMYLVTCSNIHKYQSDFLSYTSLSIFMTIFGTSLFRNKYDTYQLPAIYLKVVLMLHIMEFCMRPLNLFEIMQMTHSNNFWWLKYTDGIIFQM